MVARIPATSRRCRSEPPDCFDHSSLATMVSSGEATKTGTSSKEMGVRLENSPG